MTGPVTSLTIGVYRVVPGTGERQVLRPPTLVDLVDRPVLGVGLGFPPCQCPRCGPEPVPAALPRRPPRPELLGPSAPATRRDPVRGMCKIGAHQGGSEWPAECPGRYEIRMHSVDVAIEVGRCGCVCHDGHPVTVTWVDG
jgi:hypothetical protein